MNDRFLERAISPGYVRHTAHAFSALVQELLEWRHMARASGDYATADRIVRILAGCGIKVTATGAQTGPLFWND